MAKNRKKSGKNDFNIDVEELDKQETESMHENKNSECNKLDELALLDVQDYMLDRDGIFEALSCLA